MTRQFLVTLEVGEGETAGDVADFIREAIKAQHAEFKYAEVPDTLDVKPETVTVKHVPKRRKASNGKVRKA